MLKECWINVYKYPNSGVYYSHAIPNLKLAVMYGCPEYNGVRKTLYRIHVKMDGGWNKRKPKYDEWYLDKIVERNRKYKEMADRIDRYFGLSSQRDG